MKQMARGVHEELNVHLPDDAIDAVGYFNNETQEFIHVSGEVAQRYDEQVLVDILESAFLDAWGAINQEEMYASELHATTRVYDEYIDTVIPLGETRGIVFIIDRGAEYQYPELVEKIKSSITRYEFGVEVKS